jgi:predicted phosphohydrolase
VGDNAIVTGRDNGRNGPWHSSPTSMTVWGISDLHLSLARPERRERFAARWRDHAEHIEREWRTVVKPLDLVLLPGDISMARNHRDLQPDLAWLDRLPGTKVIAPGNHDTWWNGVDKVRPMLRRSIRAVGGDALSIRGMIVCGTRGAPVPADEPHSEAMIESDHELALLDKALASASDLRKSGEPLVVLWHYPPFDAHRRPGPCVRRFEEAGVTACLYGHLHIEGQWSLAVQGNLLGVKYSCVAADAIGFRPFKIDLERR